MARVNYESLVIVWESKIAAISVESINMPNAYIYIFKEVQCYHVGLLLVGQQWSL